MKGTITAGFDQFVVRGDGCNQQVNGIWLSYPEGTKAKAGPASILQLQPARNFAGAATSAERTAVQLDKNKDFKQFDSLLSTPYKGGGMCLGCGRYAVTATLVGRLDGAVPSLQRDGAGKIVKITGFGNLNAYSARLVLQSVSDVTQHEIDYSKAAAVTKGESPADAGGGDPVAAAHQAARAFGSSPAGDQIERAAAAFGNEGEDNGVNVGFGVPNEAAQKDESKGGSDSPDGVLFNCMFDMARLKGTALAIAISYTGSQIADIRSAPSAGRKTDVYDLEDYAWQTAVLTAVANQQKSLTLPGGYLLWNAAWPPAERNKSIDDALGKLCAGS